MVKAVLKGRDRVDILINNAGIMGPVKNVEEILVDEWDQTMAVNLRGMFLCCKHVIPIMKRQEKSSVVNIASVISSLLSLGESEEYEILEVLNECGCFQKGPIAGRRRSTLSGTWRR